MEQRRTILGEQQLRQQLDAVLAAGAAFPLEITGSSMIPFLAPGRDHVLLTPPKRLRRGDIALYRRASGAPVLHRVWRVRDGAYWFVGDAQTHVEGPFEAGQILAAANQAVRKGKLQQSGCFWWWFFRSIWLPLRPFRPLLLRIYGSAAATRTRV